jgi:hypothetical protein
MWTAVTAARRDRGLRDTSAAGTRPRRNAAESAAAADCPVGDRKVEIGDEVMEHLAGRAGMHAPPPPEGEQRGVHLAGRYCGSAVVQLCAQQRADARSVRDQAGLAELAAAHHEQGPVHVHVGQPQPARLSGAQPEPVTQREHCAVGWPAADGPWVVRQRGGRIEQAACLRDVEQERQRCGGDPPSARPQHWDGIEHLLGEGPVEQSRDDAEEVVEAAWPRPRSGAQEVVEQVDSELVEAAHPALFGKAQQQPKLCLFAQVLAAQRTPMLQEAGDGGLQLAGHRNASSPSPRATARRPSTSTFA